MSSHSITNSSACTYASNFKMDFCIAQCLVAAENRKRPHIFIASQNHYFAWHLKKITSFLCHQNEGDADQIRFPLIPCQWLFWWLYWMPMRFFDYVFLSVSRVNECTVIKSITTKNAIHYAISYLSIVIPYSFVYVCMQCLILIRMPHHNDTY